MSKDFTFEQMQAIMCSPLVNGKLTNLDEYGFSREFAFTVEGVDYNVIWYKNQSTLIIGGLQVMFNNVEISNTWPSPAGAKNKLQFRDANGNCVAVLVLERYL